MGRPAARDRKPYDAALLTDIAMSVFAERGYDGASLEDIASAAGIAKSSVYYHVAGKEDLLARGLERGFRSTFDLLEAEESADGPSIERLRNVLLRMTQGLLDDVVGVKVLLSLRGMTPTEQWARARRRELNRRVAGLVRGAIDEGDVRSELEPELVTLLLMGMLASVTDWYTEAGDHDVDQIVDAFLAVALRGIEPASP